MGVARGQRARLIGPLPSAFLGVVLLEGGSRPWRHAVPEIDQTLQERSSRVFMMEERRMTLLLALSFEQGTGTREGELGTRVRERG